MGFYVGQKVVCVDDDFGPERVGVTLDGQEWVTDGDLDGLTKGVVYTVRAVGMDPLWQEPCIWLNEIIRPVMGEPEEVGFAQRRFRPVVEQSTDTGFAILEEIRARESHELPLFA